MSDNSEHLYEGKPDARQTESGQRGAQVGGLFRKRYGQLDPRELALHDAIKSKAEELAGLIGLLNAPVAAKFEIDCSAAGAQFPLPPRNYDGGNVTLSIRHLEDAVYRAVKALTA